MIKNIHVQSCLNCRPKPICDCGNQGIGFEIKDCRRINLLVGNHGVGKSFALAHVNLEGKPFVKVLGAVLLPPTESICIEDVKNFELAMAKNQFPFPPNPIRKFLILDEIGNNTHHSIHKPFWTNLIKEIIEHDLQVFATTHSREMIQSLVKVCQEGAIDEKDFVVFSLYKDGEKNYVDDYRGENLQIQIDNGGEIR